MLIAGLHEARVSDWIRQHLLLQCEPAPADAQWCITWTFDELERAARVKHEPPSLEVLCRVRSPEDLSEACLARLRMGHLRYGSCGRSYYNAIGSCLARLDDYVSGGNREHLVDIANLIASEWLYPNRSCAWRDRQVASRDSLVPMGGLRRALRGYRDTGNRVFLEFATDCVREEWLCPSVSGAHWAPQDCGGHWSLREGVAL